MKRRNSTGIKRGTHHISRGEKENFGDEKKKNPPPLGERGGGKEITATLKKTSIRW